MTHPVGERSLAGNRWRAARGRVARGRAARGRVARGLGMFLNDTLGVTK